MKGNWLTLALVVVGAVLVLFSFGADEPLNSPDTVWFKIVGIVLLMIGLYRASRISAKSAEKQEEDD